MCQAIRCTKEIESLGLYLMVQTGYRIAMASLNQGYEALHKLIVYKPRDWDSATSEKYPNISLRALRGRGGEISKIT